ncbi:hypothetical protein ACI7RC_05895 [Brevibacillus sp. B_LB10_24]|uniref:hypothetical protein n=1 Tax=Brevibacillus sp. B_LB10_24 TaxID=3380645 RepID=UPI0038BDA170
MEKETFSELFHKYHFPLYKYLLGMCRSRETAVGRSVVGSILLLFLLYIAYMISVQILYTTRFRMTCLANQIAARLIITMGSGIN